MPETNNDDNKKNGEVKVPARGWILLLAFFGFIPLLMFMRQQVEKDVRPLTPSEFLQKVENNEIAEGIITFTPGSLLQKITGELAPVQGAMDADGKPAKGEPFALKMHLTESIYDDLIASEVFRNEEPDTLWINVFMSLLPFVILALIIYFLLHPPDPNGG